MKKLLRNNVLIEPEGLQTHSAGGILLPESEQIETFKAKVIDVGPDVKELKKDDQVIYGPFKRERYVKDDVVYLVIREADIYGVLE